MSFLFSIDGLIYNAPAALVLGVLLWKRPYIGIVMAGMACIRLWGPMTGAGELLNASAHMSLGVVSAFAWERNDVPGTLALLGLGIGLLVFTGMTVGWLLPNTADVATALQRGTVIGGILATLRAIAWGLALVRKKSPTTSDGA